MQCLIPFTVDTLTAGHITRLVHFVKFLVYVFHLLGEQNKVAAQDGSVLSYNMMER